MAYTPYNADWKDYPDTTTPVTAAALEHIETGVDGAHTLIDDHIADTADAHDASAVSVADAGGYFAGTEVEAVLQEIGAGGFGAPTGSILPFGGVGTLPSGWLLCDGSAVSRATYASLWAALSDSKGAATITIASPGVVTNTGHGFTGGERVHFTTTGALPTGLAVDTDYWVIYVDANTFRLASTQANYLTSTAINTSGTQSGTHTLYHAPYGISGASNFLLPDLRGRAPFGQGTHLEMSGQGLDEGATVGNRSASHHHLEDPAPPTGGYSGSGYGANYNAAQAKTTGNANLQDKPAYVIVRFIIRT